MKRDELLPIMTEIGNYSDAPFAQVQIEAWHRTFALELASVLQRAWHRFLEIDTTGRRPTPGQLMKLCNEIRARDADVGTEGKREIRQLDVFSGVEGAAWGAVITEILLWHSLGLRQTQVSTLEAGYFDIEAWNRNGRLPTWSPILDWVLGEVLGSWNTPEPARVGTLRGCLEYLQAQRKQQEPTGDETVIADGDMSQVMAAATVPPGYPATGPDPSGSAAASHQRGAP